jgi:hypothetical protein
VLKPRQPRSQLRKRRWGRRPNRKKRILSAGVGMSQLDTVSAPEDDVRDH